MEIHQLRYVIAVVDTGSFTAAAEAVRVSQSGVSTQVKKLERELGVALFDRSARQVTLTAEGERMLPVIRSALQAIGEVPATAADLRGLLRGTLRVGVVSGLTWPRLFDALSELHTAHPGLDIRLREGTSEHLTAQLRRGECDIAVVAWAQHPPAGLESATIFDDPLVAVVAPDHAWATRTSIRPAELSGVDIIALPTGTGDRSALAELLPGVTPRWEVSTPWFVERLAARGIGVGIVSDATRRRWTEVRAVPIAAPDVRSRLGIAWPHSPTRAATAMRELLAG
ncbi:LysR family transcriptional regulator [Microbacterium sp. H1-D42]|uniref:LysR family transcriptional regulator n=1 Tax=Microbacterium sp. H1-D42 TaxID=2925844 RepID=UPI001F539946|nr:LysR family transcriptional regulator [Microbacterium sp. H1-D42]UNK70193.1 LysR family transcriptional regulator [Microbacterium sp. H1-D42]